MTKQAKTDAVIAQLSRISGQVDGISRMYQSEASCVEIARQILAARSSLASVARKILSGEVARCSREQNMDDVDDLLKELFRH